MPGPLLPAELVLMIMHILAGGRRRRTLLALSRACRSFYALGMPALLRRIDVHAGNLGAVANRVKWTRPRRRSLEAPSPMLDELGAVREVSVALADVDRLGMTLREALVDMRNLRKLEIDCTGAGSHDAAYEVMSWVKKALAEVAVTSADVKTVQYMLQHCSKWKGTGLLVFDPADPPSFGSRETVRSLKPHSAPKTKRRGWKVEIRGLVDCRAGGGWNLKRQRKYWAAYGHGASVVP